MSAVDWTQSLNNLKIHVFGLWVLRGDKPITFLLCSVIHLFNMLLIPKPLELIKFGISEVPVKAYMHICIISMYSTGQSCLYYTFLVIHIYMDIAELHGKVVCHHMV